MAQEILHYSSGTLIPIETPFMGFSKADMWAAADEFGVMNTIIKNTLTCYVGSEKMNDWGYGCGECHACKLRAEGYYQYIEFKNGKTESA